MPSRPSTSASPACGNGAQTTSAAPDPRPPRPPAPSAARLPARKASSQPRFGASAAGHEGALGRALAVEVGDGHPGGSDHAAGVADDGLEQLVDAVGAHQLGGRLQGVEPRIVAGVGDRAHLLHGDAVDLANLGDQQVDQARGGRSTTTSSTACPFSRSRMSIPTTSPRTAPMRLATCPRAPGPVGKPHADDERRHDPHPTEPL